MTKFDNTLTNIAYLYDCLMDYRLILASGCCNDCSKMKNCEYAPKPGQLVRYNCPFYREEENGPIIATDGSRWIQDIDKQGLDHGRMKELVEEAIKDQEAMLSCNIGEPESYAVRYCISILKDILKQYEYLRNDEEAVNDSKRRNATSE